MQSNSNHTLHSTAVTKQFQTFSAHKFVPSVELNNNEWNILLTGAPTVEYDIGDVILRQGESNEFLFRLESGTVRVVKGDTYVFVADIESFVSNMYTSGQS